MQVPCQGGGARGTRKAAVGTRAETRTHHTATHPTTNPPPEAQHHPPPSTPMLMLRAPGSVVLDGHRRLQVGIPRLARLRPEAAPGARVPKPLLAGVGAQVLLLLHRAAHADEVPQGAQVGLGGVACQVDQVRPDLDDLRRKRISKCKQISSFTSKLPGAR